MLNFCSYFANFFAIFFLTKMNEAKNAKTKQNFAKKMQIFYIFFNTLFFREIFALFSH